MAILKVFDPAITLDQWFIRSYRVELLKDRQPGIVAWKGAETEEMEPFIVDK